MGTDPNLFTEKEFTQKKSGDKFDLELHLKQRDLEDDYRDDNGVALLCHHRLCTAINKPGIPILQHGRLNSLVVAVALDDGDGSGHRAFGDLAWTKDRRFLHVILTERGVMVSQNRRDGPYHPHDILLDLRCRLASHGIMPGHQFWVRFEAVEEVTFRQVVTAEIEVEFTSQDARDKVFSLYLTERVNRAIMDNIANIHELSSPMRWGKQFQSVRTQVRIKSVRPKDNK